MKASGWSAAVGVVLVAAAVPALGSAYSMTDLGGLGGDSTGPLGMNDADHVVGVSRYSGFLGHGFVWIAGAMEDLGTLGGTQSQARDINNHGVIVGWANPADTSDHMAFIYEGGVMSPLGTLGGEESWATAINDSGTIAGWAHQADGKRRAFRYSGGTMAGLGTLGGNDSLGLGINGAGDIVGWSDKSWGTNRPFKDVGGTMTALPVPGGPLAGGEAWSINDHGVVAGYAELEQGGAYHALIWDETGYHDLGVLTGTKSMALSINNSGQVVGYSYLAGDTVQHAFLYENGTMYDLNDLTTNNPGWVIEGAQSINADGNICAWVDADGETRAVLLTLMDVPEPGTIGLFALGLALLGSAARRYGRQTA